jgi:hypothetical protein
MDKMRLTWGFRYTKFDNYLLFTYRICQSGGGRSAFLRVFRRVLTGPFGG